MLQRLECFYKNLEDPKDLRRGEGETRAGWDGKGSSDRCLRAGPCAGDH